MPHDINMIEIGGKLLTTHVGAMRKTTGSTHCGSARLLRIRLRLPHST